MADTAPPSFQPAEIVATLDRHRVDYVVIGGLAAVWHGAPYITNDIDITPRNDPTNLGRLSAALHELEARVRLDELGRETLPFEHDAESLARSEILNLTTRAGNLDISLVPSGTRGYPDLQRDSLEISVGGARPRVASLADVIRSKEAADRPKDRVALPVLRRLLEEQQAQRRAGRSQERRGPTHEM